MVARGEEDHGDGIGVATVNGASAHDRATLPRHVLHAPARLVDHDEHRGSRCVTVIGAGEVALEFVRRLCTVQRERAGAPMIIHLVHSHPELGRAESSAPAVELPEGLDRRIREAQALATPGTRILVHFADIDEVQDHPSGAQLVHMTTGDTMTTDAVVYALDRRAEAADGDARYYADAAEVHGLRYRAIADDTEEASISADDGEGPIVRGTGARALHATARWAEQGRRGAPALLGGGRGLLAVPALADETTRVPIEMRYIDVDVASALVEAASSGARTLLRPYLVKELTHAYYREFFAAHPDRVRVPWHEFLVMLDREDPESAPFERFVETAVPASGDRFSVRRRLHPFETVGPDIGPADGDVDAIVSDALDRELATRASDARTEERALSRAAAALLRVLAAVSDAPTLDAQSQRDVVGVEWPMLLVEAFIGVPPSLLERIRALHALGEVRFLGAPIAIRVDRGGEASATSAFEVSGPAGSYRRRSFLDAIPTPPDVRRNAHPALADLVGRGECALASGRVPRGSAATGRLRVRRRDGRLLRSDGTVFGRRFAIGPYSSTAPFGWESVDDLGAAPHGWRAAVAESIDPTARDIVQIIADLRSAHGIASSLVPGADPVAGFDGAAWFDPDDDP